MKYIYKAWYIALVAGLGAFVGLVAWLTYVGMLSVMYFETGSILVTDLAEATGPGTYSRFVSLAMILTLAFAWGAEKIHHE